MIAIKNSKIHTELKTLVENSTDLDDLNTSIVNYMQNTQRLHPDMIQGYNISFDGCNYVVVAWTDKNRCVYVFGSILR